MTENTTPSTPEEFERQGWRKLSKEEVESLFERFQTLSPPPDCALASNDGKKWEVDVYVCMCIDLETACWTKKQ